MCVCASVCVRVCVYTFLQCLGWMALLVGSIVTEAIRLVAFAFGVLSFDLTYL